MKIYACHLLNDYSGSPKVLSQLVNGWAKKNIDVTIITCKNKTGFLSNIENVNYSYFWYKWSANPFIRLITFSLSQILLFYKLIFILKKNDTVYVNTILPFGAAIAGKIKRCKIIYHIHETSMKPKILKWFLFKIVNLTANDVIYVSNYLSKQEKIENKIIHILYNAMDNAFLEKAQSFKKDKIAYKNVLMVCSLKSYKGVDEFIKLATVNLDLNFKLVLNTSQEEIDTYFKTSALPPNVQFYPSQSNTHPFYEWADIVLNLSKPNEWIETFGLTILEAMAYQLPVIIPPIGGITELVEEGINGFKVDSRNLETLSIKLNEILKNNTLYNKMKNESLNKIKSFNEEEFISKSISIIN